MARPLLLPLPELRRWTTLHAAAHPKDFTRALAAAFGVTRAAAAPAVRQLELEGFLTRHGGSTRPVFTPGPSRFVETSVALPGVDESAVWETHFAPYLGLQPALDNRVHYALTEMVNNANDHAGGQHLTVRCAVAGGVLYLWIVDDGIGVFERLSLTLGLQDRRLAVLELSKGRVTTDPKNHTGEGIFFTSRAFSVFKIEANGLVYERRNRELDHGDAAAASSPPLALPPAPRLSGADAETGTRVTMAVRLSSTLALRDIFNRYTTGAPDDLSFDRTVIPVRLARLGGENLLSRSQAKRVLSGIDKFKVVELDFEGVPEIGQAFADEIFRVFAAAHPEVSLRAVHAGPGVLPMIRRVEAR